MSEVDLPKGWVSAPLSDTGVWVGGGTPSKMNKQFWEGHIPWVSPKDMKVLEIVDTKDHISDKAIEQSSVRLLREGSVLFVTRSGILAHSFPVAISKVPLTVNQDIKAIIPSEKLSAKYLAWALRAKERDVLNKCTKYGTTVHSIEVPSLKELKIGFPSKSEQERIVTKIETLFSELDKGIESLKTAREQLRIYRQAVLKRAFEGKLTAQWREKNKGRLESPEQLLARIQKERQARYQQQLKAWQAAVKVWEGSNKEGKKPRKPSAPVVAGWASEEELSELPSLPKNWRWVRPEMVAAEERYAIGIGPFGSNLKVSDYRNSGVPLVFVRNITRANFTENLKYIDYEKYEELVSHSVAPLDLLITKMGDPPGDCEIYPKDRPMAVLTADCLKFRVFECFVDRRFYKNCINSNMFKRQLGLITKGVAQKKISVDRFKTTLLPFTSLEEQTVIADRIEEIFSIIEEQENAITLSIGRSEALRQSILKKAFSGKLISGPNLAERN